jgi:hypothetical protein
VTDYSTGYYDILAVNVPPFNISTTTTSSSSSDSQSPYAGLKGNSFNGLFSTITTALKSPLIVPTLQQFLSVQSLITTVVSKGASTDLALQTSQGQTYGNLLRVGELHFAPNTPLVYDLIQYLNTTTPLFRTLNYTVHSSEKAVIKYILSKSRRDILAVIIINAASNNQISYDIRMDYTTIPNTNKIIDYTTVGLNLEYQKYLLSGFLSIQSAIDAWAWNNTRSNLLLQSNAANSTLASNQCRAIPSPFAFPFPTPEYEANAFFTSVGFLLGLALTLASLYPMSRLTKSVVEEKEIKMREIMKIMGLYDWANQLSWFIIAFMVFLWIAVSSTIISTSSFLPSTNTTILFLYYFLFAMSVISVSFFISVFFNNSKLAAIFAPVFLFVTILPRFAFLNTNENEVYAAKYWACLLPGTAFSFGMY